MTNKSSPWLERQRRDRAGPKVLTPDEAEAARLPLTVSAVSYHVYSGNRHPMTEFDLWVGGDFSTPSVPLDAKLSDGSPRFIKRPDGTMFDLYGTATRAAMAEPNCPASEVAAGGLTAQNSVRPFFPPVGTAVNTLHWVQDGIARPEAMEWTGDAWLMIGDAMGYGPEHTELRGCEYLGSAHAEDEMAAYRAGLERDEARKNLDSVIGKFNYACNAVSELQTDLNAVTTERNALRDALAKFTDPDVKPPEPPINHALRVKIGDPRRMGIGGTG